MEELRLLKDFVSVTVSFWVTLIRFCKRDIHNLEV